MKWKKVQERDNKLHVAITSHQSRVSKKVIQNFVYEFNKVLQQTEMIIPRFDLI